MRSAPPSWRWLSCSGLADESPTALPPPPHALSCWSLALIAILIWNPSTLVDPGAQLSFGVVLGLILFSPPLMRWGASFFQPDPFLPHELLTTAQRREEQGWRWVCALLASGIAASCISEPITAIDFHQVTPIAVLANLVANSFPPRDSSRSSARSASRLHCSVRGWHHFSTTQTGRAGGQRADWSGRFSGARAGSGNQRGRLPDAVHAVAIVRGHGSGGQRLVAGAHGGPGDWRW